MTDREKAEKATPGPWHHIEGWKVVDPDGWGICDIHERTGQDNAQFIAYFNPKKILEMIDQIEELRRQLSIQRDNNHARNLDLDALHYVWCNGGCDKGVHRWSSDEVTREIVDVAIRNVGRLVEWFNNHNFRKLDEFKPGKAYDAESYRHTWHRIHEENEQLKSENEKLRKQLEIYKLSDKCLGEVEYEEDKS